MIKVFKPWISVKDIYEVNKALMKKEISGASINVKNFEDKFKSKIGTNYAVAVSNGSVALDLAFKTLNLTEEDEVIIPSFSIISCLSSVVRSGAKPVFADVDRLTFNIGLNDIKKVMTNRTKAILIVHTYGLPVDVVEIKEFCNANNVFLIEDSAEAHGLKVNNSYCGSFGDISTFSFYANKHLTAGEGGMVLTQTKEIYEKLLQMRNLDFSNERRFYHNNFFWNYRMSGLQAALGYSQIDQVDKVINKKQIQGKVYNELLSSVNKIQLPLKEYMGIKNNYWVYGIVLKENGIRDSLIEKMFLEGVETRPFFWPLHLQPAYLNLKIEDRVKLPNSEFIGLNGLYLPLGSHINLKIQKKIVSILTKCLNSFN